MNSVFEDHQLTTVMVSDKLMWSCSEISSILGYSRPNILADTIRDEWRNEFSEGVHYSIIRGEELRQMTGNTRHQALFLTEAGVNRVLLLTRKKIGIRLRDHLDRVVLPQLRRGMIEERPYAELEARYQRELLEVSKEARTYAAKVIERDEKIMQLQEEKAVFLGAVPSIKKQASDAGRLLHEQKGTKRLREMN